MRRTTVYLYFTSLESFFGVGIISPMFTVLYCLWVVIGATIDLLEKSCLKLSRLNSAQLVKWDFEMARRDKGCTWRVLFLVLFGFVFLEARGEMCLRLYSWNRRVDPIAVIKLLCFFIEIVDIVFFIHMLMKAKKRKDFDKYKERKWKNRWWLKMNECYISHRNFFLRSCFVKFIAREKMLKCL